MKSVKLEERKQVINWKGTSDTETLLVAIDIIGIDEALTDCVGMFAFAILDKKGENTKTC